MKRKKKIIAAGILFFIPISFLFGQISKDTTSKTNNLNPVSVYYNRWERKINEVPNRITKFNFKEQRLQNPQTMADAIELTGEVLYKKVKWVEVAL